jgi:hypothetical protein
MEERAFLGRELVVLVLGLVVEGLGDLEGDGGDPAAGFGPALLELLVYVPVE